MKASASGPGLQHLLHRVATRALLRLHDWGLPALVLATAVCFGLALLDRLAADEGSTPLWLALLETATAQSNDKGVWNKLWHLLLAFTVGWAGIAAYMAAMGFRLEGWFVRTLCRDHLVIMAGPGPGEARPAPTGGPGSPLSTRAQMAIELAQSSAPRHSVVLCLPGLDAGTLRRLWAAGVHALPDDLPGPEILRLARIDRARWLVAMRDSFDENVVLTQAALAKGGPGLGCRIMVPTDTQAEVPALEAFFSRERLHRVRAFNTSEMVARHLLQRFPPDQAVARQAGRRVHVLLVGLGTVGQALVVRMAHLAHYGSGLQARVSVVDDPGAANWQRLHARRPLLGQVLGVRLLPGGAARLEAGAVRAWLQGEAPVTMVYVCTKDEVFNLRVARLLLQVWPPGEAPQIVVLDPPGGQALADLKEEFEADPDTRGRVELFSLSSANPGTGIRAPLLGSLMQDLDDSLARAVHADYQERAVSAASARVAWEDLGEGYRASNRWAGDHFEIKLRAVGRRWADPPHAGPPEAWGEMELDRLGRMEHARWVSEKALGGACLGHDASRGDRSTLVPFAYLPPDEAYKARHQVTSLVDYLRHRAPADERRALAPRPDDGAREVASDDDPGPAHRAALASRLAASLLDARPGAEGGQAAQVWLYGSGDLAEGFVTAVVHGLDESTGAQADALRITWVRRAASACQHALGERLAERVRTGALQIVEAVLDERGRLEAAPAPALAVAAGGCAVYLLPDPAERLPGLIETWAQRLRELAAAGHDTALPITALCWEPAPCAPVREGFMGAATLEWVAAREG